MLSVLGPRVMRASTMNVVMGALTMPLPFALSSPTRADVARSVMEGIAYAIRANLEQVEEIAGARATHVALGGGMSGSRVFAAMVANVLGRSMRVPGSAQTTALGAAAIASPAFGLHATIDKAIESTSSRSTTIEPDLRISAAYDDSYARWSAMAEQLQSGGV